MSTAVAPPSPSETPAELKKSGAERTPKEERGALDYLLAKKPALEYTCKVDYETPEGVKPIDWTIKALDGRVIDRVEESHRNENTGKLDQISADCELVATATVELLDSTGHKVDIASEEFRQGLASPQLALEKAFSSQMGLISGVAREVRRISAWDPERVGKAQRNLVEAASD